MRMSKLKYSFSEAKKNVLRNGLMSVASLFTIASCLVILGVFAIISMNVNAFTSKIEDQCEVQLYINKGTSAERVAQIGEEILKIENVKEASLFTKEDMLAYAKNDMFGEDAELLSGFEDDNPFSDSYKIILESIENTDTTVSELEKIQDVEKIVNKQDIVNMVLNLSKIVKRFSMAIMLVLLIIAIVIISNTVRLTVFNRRKEINIMKYIGATDRFIKGPFLLEGMIIGFFGALLAFLVVFWGYFALLKYVAGIGIGTIELIGMWQILPIVAVIFVVFGCIIGVLGSGISMRRYLHV
ncbi:MAG: permease-like cell division protein FtsX [Clostridia bacterium]|nr:permease-like cell division protein FtsX [Clostridia bacterium]